MAPVGTKADEIALALEDAIVSGEIPPGTVLRQEQLSEQFEVSRTPVREALRRLAAPGLVSFVPNRGVRVRELSRDELREAFLVRAELESLATELATPRIDDRGAGRARGRRGAVRGADARRARPLARRRASDCALAASGCARTMASTTSIYAAAHAPHVERLAKSARRTFLSQWRAARPRASTSSTSRTSAQHRAIRDAIAARSAAGARALAREHVLHSGRMLEAILDHVEASAPGGGSLLT